jgi:hypothetical protein
MAATPKAGDWIQITKIKPNSNWQSDKPGFTPPTAPAILKVVGTINRLICFKVDDVVYGTYRSNLQYNILSPKKHKALEALYGNKIQER